MFHGFCFITGRFPNLPSRSYHDEDVIHNSQCCYLYSLINPMHPHSKIFSGTELEEFCRPAELGGLYDRTSEVHGDCSEKERHDFGRGYEVWLRKYLNRMIGGGAPSPAKSHSAD